MQQVQLDKNVILLDSPGVVLSTKEQSDSLILRQAIKIEELLDPIAPVESLIKRVERDELMSFYGFESNFNSVDEFLGHIARK
jgi:nuclear GTP-binding protein